VSLLYEGRTEKACEWTKKWKSEKWK